MKLNPEKLQLALVLRIQWDRSHGRYGHIVGSVEKVSHVEECGFTSLPYGYPLSNVITWSQTSEGHPEIYGYEIVMSHRGNHSSLYELEQATKVIRPIYSAMQRMYNEEGRPLSYGQWVSRVARAIGANRIVCQRLKPAHNGSKYWIGNRGDSIAFVDEIARDLSAWSNDPNFATPAAAVA